MFKRGVVRGVLQLSESGGPKCPDSVLGKENTMKV